MIPPFFFLRAEELVTQEWGHVGRAEGRSAGLHLTLNVSAMLWSWHHFQCDLSPSKSCAWMTCEQPQEHTTERLTNTSARPEPMCEERLQLPALLRFLRVCRRCHNGIRDHHRRNLLECQLFSAADGHPTEMSLAAFQCAETTHAPPTSTTFADTPSNWLLPFSGGPFMKMDRQARPSKEKLIHVHHSHACSFFTAPVGCKLGHRVPQRGKPWRSC